MLDTGNEISSGLGQWNLVTPQTHSMYHCIICFVYSFIEYAGRQQDEMQYFRYFGVYLVAVVC